MVPAPTACTDAAAPPDRMRITTSMLMDVLIAHSTAKIVKSVKETM
jgi:hypothetical protein